MATIGLVKGAYWVNDPNLCPKSALSQTCSGTTRECGQNGGVLFCYEPSLLNPPSSSANSETDYSGSYNGGYLINCEAYDGTAPHCDNGGAFWCDRESTYYNVGRKTICNANKWSGQTGATSGGTCRSNYFYCDGSYTDADGCELYGGQSCGFGTGSYVYNQCVGSTGNCTRTGNNMDCDNDDSDNNEITCNGATNGCEVVNGSACSVGGLAGTIQGCSGGAGLCVISPQDIATTGEEVVWSGTNPMLWITQLGAGLVFNFTDSNGINFIMNTTGLFWNGTLVGSGSETDPIWTADKPNYYNKTDVDSFSLSHWTDDLGDRGYTSLSNFTNDVGYITSETDPIWTADKTNYYTKINIDGFSLSHWTDDLGNRGYTHLSNFTDDLGDRGYTHLSNFTDDLGNRGYTHLSNFTDDIDYSTKNVNSSNYWDNLNSPSEIKGSDIQNDLNWINTSGETDQVWTSEKSQYRKLTNNNFTISGNNDIKFLLKKIIGVNYSYIKGTSQDGSDPVFLVHKGLYAYADSLGLAQFSLLGQDFSKVWTFELNDTTGNLRLYNNGNFEYSIEANLTAENITAQNFYGNLNASYIQNPTWYDKSEVYNKSEAEANYTYILNKTIHDVTSSRSMGVTYTNNYGRAIRVEITYWTWVCDMFDQVYINLESPAGTTLQQQGIQAYSGACAGLTGVMDEEFHSTNIVVPDGQTYQVNQISNGGGMQGGMIQKWIETEI